MLALLLELVISNSGLLMMTSDIYPSLEKKNEINAGFKYLFCFIGEGICGLVTLLFALFISICTSDVSMSYKEMSCHAVQVLFVSVCKDLNFLVVTLR